MGPIPNLSIKRALLNIVPGTLALCGALAMPVSAFANSADNLPTASPIKHVIVVIGENQSFDFLYGTYKPANSSQFVSNLLSKGIVNANDTAGPAAMRAAQFTVSPQTQYFVAAPASAKTAYATLPPPDLEGVASTDSDTPSPYFQSPSGPPPFADTATAGAAEPFLNNSANTTQSAYDLHFLTTGDSRMPGVQYGPDTRIANVNSLPNGPFHLAVKDPRDANMAPAGYDAYTSDIVHRFYQMWQQFDCSVSHRTKENPSGCLADLLPYVATTFPAASQSTQWGQGKMMGYLNMQAGDAPYFKSLADQYTISDNYHQAIMGGTGPNHMLMQTGDAFYWTGLTNSTSGTPVNPNTDATLAGLLAGLTSGAVTSAVANPNPQPGTNNRYINDPDGTYGVLTGCADTTQPGVAAVQGYLSSLPWKQSPTTCQPGAYYLVNNACPSFHPDGTPPAMFVPTPAASPFGGATPFQVLQATGSVTTMFQAMGYNAQAGVQGITSDQCDFSFIGQQTVPTIGDKLTQANISWAYYGDGFNNYLTSPNHAVWTNFPTLPPNAYPGDFSGGYCRVCNAMAYSKNYPNYVKLNATHTGAAANSNTKDSTDLLADIDNGNVPAVSILKASAFVDGHPQSSRPALFEAFARRIVQKVQANPALAGNTAVIITFDESGGTYDSGFVQPVDFFGDGPRVPMIVVSPWSTGGKISHAYNDHVSILKFIERNWSLTPLSARSRDNLANPVQLPSNPYVPTNMPAVGDLFDMFTFN